MSDDAADGRLSKMRRALQRRPRDLADVHQLLDQAKERRLINPEVLTIVRRAVDMQDARVRDIMVPRSQIQILRMEDSLEKWLQEIDKSKHSRYPVSKGDRGEIVGLLMTKDLMSHIHDTGGTNFQQRMSDRQIMLRPALSVSEGQRIIEVLGEFRTKRSHMAVVLDEHGSTAGLLTLEDALEQIIGEIEDEHDHSEHRIIPRNGGSAWEVDALTPIAQFSRHFDIKLDDGQADTIGGHIMQQLARVPGKGENLDLGGLRIKIEDADKRRVLSLLVTKHSAADFDSDAS